MTRYRRQRDGLVSEGNQQPWFAFFWWSLRRNMRLMDKRERTAHPVIVHGAAARMTDSSDPRSPLAQCAIALQPAVSTRASVLRAFRFVGGDGTPSTINS
jgi:hypothetical protein